MNTTPSNNPKSLSEFMADLEPDVGLPEAAEAAPDWHMQQPAADNNWDVSFDDIEVSATFKPLRETEYFSEDGDYEAAWDEAETEGRSIHDATFASEEAERLEDPSAYIMSLGGALDDDEIIEAPLDVIAAPSSNTGSLMVIAATLLACVGSAFLFVQSSQSSSSDVALSEEVAAHEMTDENGGIVPATARTVCP